MRVGSLREAENSYDVPVAITLADFVDERCRGINRHTQFGSDFLNFIEGHRTAFCNQTQNLDAKTRLTRSQTLGEVRGPQSYTPLLMPQFHNLIRPTQTQAASGPGGPAEMKPHVGISGSRAFFGRHGVSPAPDSRFRSDSFVAPGSAVQNRECHNYETMIGSDATRVPDHEAGRIQPSRFLTHYLCTELQQAFGRAPYTITNEWSGTVSYTPDEFPVVGVFDGKRQYILGGMAGSGTAVSFNGARCIVSRILGDPSNPDDYPEEYFSPMRLLDPEGHTWPELEEPT